MTDHDARDGGLPSGHIRFYDHFLPPLPAGSYRLSAGQTITRSGIDADHDFLTERDFHVRGPRFGLGPSDVHAVYPPADSDGNDRFTLPHVVLRRRTLPWEIDVSGGTRTDPWMALLVFGPDEAPRVRTGPAERLLGPSPHASPRRPDLHLRSDELDRQLTVVDIRAADVATVLPRRADLEWTAHVRQVRTDGKELLGLAEDGWFAVVIANRFPTPGFNVAHLVSLEGWADALDGDISAGGRYRMVSLASWSFTTSDRGSFGDKMEALGGRVGLLTTGRRAATAPAGDHEDVEKIVDRALDDGFVPLPYAMRHGEETVGWYRGPLTPVPVPRTDRGPLPTAEAGLVYHRDLGMFDVSYAVAWQMGRLLALSDRAFADELMRWRATAQERIDHVIAQQRAQHEDRVARSFTGLGELVARARSVVEPEDFPRWASDTRYAAGDHVRHDSVSTGETRVFMASEPMSSSSNAPDTEAGRADGWIDVRSALADELRTLVLQLWDPASVATAVSRFATEEVFARLVDEDILPTAAGRRGGDGGERDVSSDHVAGGPAPEASADGPTGTDLEEVERSETVLGLTELANGQVPPAVRTWLGRLALLYGVPFEYLVPDATMLPIESVRFFYVDTNWLEALVDGAFSVGVHSERDIRFHGSLHAAIRRATDIAAGSLRSDLRGEEATAVTDDGRVRGGFLMRSEIVSGWPGLEVVGHVGEDTSTPEVPLLRMERLTPDLLLCVFAQAPGLVVVHEPAEDLHFGIAGRNKVVVRPNTAPDHGGAEVTVAWRGPAGDRRLDLRALAARLRRNDIVKADVGERSFGPADLAVRMVDEPTKQHFVRNEVRQ